MTVLCSELVTLDVRERFLVEAVTPLTGIVTKVIKDF
jgi:hypothetical protein